MNTNFFVALKLAINTVWQHLRNSFIKESWLTVSIAIVVFSTMFIPGRIEHLTFRYDLVFKHGEWWRIITAPFVHFNWDHFSWNFIVMVASSLVLEHLNRKAYLYYLPLAIITTTIYKFYAESSATSAGFSNLASGNFSLLLLLFFWEGIKRKDIYVTLIPMIMLILFIGHELGMIGEQTGWQFLSGRSISEAPGKEIKPGHIVGIITGIFISLVFALTQAIKTKHKQRH